jgi:hypothetical protein
MLPAVSSAQWAQLGSDIDGEAAGDRSGSSVALSSDGSRVAIGAPDSDDNGTQSGHVRVFEWDAATGTWLQIGFDIVGEAAYDKSGFSVALSSNGSRVAVGAYQNDDSGTNSGHVRIHEWDGVIRWVQLGQDINGEAAHDLSGFSVALSSDGSRVAIGAPYNDDNGDNAGQVRVFRWDGLSWIQMGFDIDGEAADDLSGYSVALSPEGSHLAIGGPFNDGTGADSGHVKVYRWSSVSQNWHRVGQDIDGEAVGDSSGHSVAISSGGSHVAVGAPENDGSVNRSGHVRVYRWVSPNWVQMGQDIDGERSDDISGFSVSLSSDGSRVAIGAPYNDDSGTQSGHVRVYEWSPSTETWHQLGQDIDGEAAGDNAGHSVAISPGGCEVAVGAPENSGGGNDSGHVRVYSQGLFADGFESGDTSAWSATVP